MPTSRDDDDRDRRRRRKHKSADETHHDRDRDRDSTSSRDKQRPSDTKNKSGSSTKLHKIRPRSTSRERVRERDRDTPKSVTASERSSARKKVEMVVPEMERRPNGLSSSEIRSKTSYPTFSKAHSREAVGNMEDARNPTKPFTPPATDVGVEREKRRNSTPAKPPVNPPPSPPLTAENPDIGRSNSGASLRNKAADDIAADANAGRWSVDGGSTPRGSPRGSHIGVKTFKSGASLRSESTYGRSEISSMPGAFPDDMERKTTPSSGYRRTVSTASQPASTVTQNTTSTSDSNVTSVAPERKAPARQYPRVIPTYDHSPPSVTDSQPKTPTQDYVEFASQPIKTPILDGDEPSLDSPKPFGMTPVGVTPPPPPPPPIASAQAPPRVDYLLKNGGLPSMVPRRLVNLSPQVQQYAMYQSPQIMQQAPMEDYARVFSTLHKRLDDYMQVLRTNGSLAVATGYKSVARRLLDKLSQVFARDISSERCDCVMCKTTPQPTLSDEEDSGVSWGEILEFVSGRRDLPQWLPFTIQPDDTGLGISGTAAKPMQKLDIDVPEEYKDHYIRQNQKTKRAVMSWLTQQPESQSAPPEEADEDTLMFAMMTKLSTEQRNFFLALMHGQSFVSEARAPTPAERPAQSSNALNRTRKALQRLYRLEKPPRDCESAMYLLNNPHLHGMLATLAEVNEAEWDILVSGRFDGFLWSGAEASFPHSASQYGGSRVPSRAANGTPLSRGPTPFSGLSAVQSRGPTPFSPLRNVMSPDNTQQAPSVFPSRGPTPALSGGISKGVVAPGPVQLDEDTEVAVLAEVERNLYTDMERFEDAFEILHSRAELVRQLLRERSAGLAMQAQLRRGSGAGGDDDMFVRLDTPASGVTDFEEEGDDDGLGDLASLAPDDSASQISVSRRHRHKERRKARTPAAVLEEDESVFEEDVSGGARGAVPTGRKSKY